MPESGLSAWFKIEVFSTHDERLWLPTSDHGFENQWAAHERQQQSCGGGGRLF
jgi:hypothetical protein